MAKAVKNQQRTNTRLEQVFELKLAWNEESQAYSNNYTGISMAEITSLSDSKWNTVYHNVKSKIEYTEIIPFTEGEHMAETIDANAIVNPVTPVTPITELAESKTGIFKLDFNEATIATWNKAYASIKVESLDDKANISLIEEGKRITRKARTTLDKKRKELNEEDQAKIDKRNTIAKSVQSLIEVIESNCDIQLAQVNKWVEEAKQKEKEEAEAELKRRVELLKGEGMAFNGAYYVIGPVISMDILTIQTMSLPEFQTLYGKVVIEKKRLDDEAAKAEADRLAKEEADLLEREEFDRKKKEMENQQAAMDKQKKEMEDQKAEMKKQITDMRKQRIAMIGMKKDDSVKWWYFENEFASLKILNEFVDGSSDEDLNDTLAEYAQKIQDALSKEQEKANAAIKLKERTSAREKQLIDLGMSQVANGFLYALPFVDKQCLMYNAHIVEMESSDWPEIIKVIEDTITEIKDARKAYDAAEVQRLANIAEFNRLAEELYTNRSNQLINIGMVIENGYFIRRDQFDNIASISITKVKETSLDDWGVMLAIISELVNDLNHKTQVKLDDIAAA